MKKKLIFAVFIAGWFSIHSQSICENDSLYIIAIERYIVELDSFYMRYSKEPYERNDVIFLEKTDWFKNVPSSIKDVEVVLLDENWKDVYRKHGRELMHLKIFPIKIYGNFIKISLTPYHGRLRMGKLLLGISDWTNVYFKYNCKSGCWEYYRTENEGI